MIPSDKSAAILGVISILYPLFAAFAVQTFGPAPVIVGLCLLLVLRSIGGASRKLPVGLTLGLLVVAAAIGLVALYDRDLSVRLYPAFMNAALLAAFAQTLVSGPSMIERFARLAEPNLSEAGVRYTRKVTWVWIGFFAINGAIATATALYADWRVWTLYNGVIAYIAISFLLGGEYIVRRRVRGKPAP
jgi:uncharacterized membrane protein